MAESGPLVAEQCDAVAQSTRKQCQKWKAVGDKKYCKTHRRMYEKYLNSEQALLDYWEGMADAASY